METLVLQRYGSTPMGTFGELIIGAVRLYTVEQPWNNNTPFHSCIPVGEYRLVPHSTTKYPFAWCMVNHDLGVSHQKEPGMQRYACLIHKANYASQLQGCIAPGMRQGVVANQWAVQQSADAVELILDALPKDEEHRLIIQWQEH